MDERIRTVSIFLVNSEGRVLAQLRDDKSDIPFPNHWSTLGGRIEAGETPDEAARRELLEETELCPPLTFWRVFEQRFPVNGAQVEAEIHAYVGEVAVPLADIHLHEGQCLDYLSLDDIDRLPFAFGLDRLFRAFFAEAALLFKQLSPNGASRPLRITLATAEDALLVHRLMCEAFAEYIGVLNPPSGANRETVEDVLDAMAQGGALIAWDGETPVGSARFRLDPDELYIGRVAVPPAYRQRGVAKVIMRHMEEVARHHGRYRLHVGVRMSLPSNIRLYQSLGYRIAEIGDHPKGPDRVATMIKELLMVGKDAE
ncbi:MAG: GNAT family N-acetyltransferase [Anaerolineae bacterium]|nr:GNAT family N-acetyltransferase [Anaerolineae bacterium]